MASSLRLPVGSFASSTRPTTMISQYGPVSQIRSFSQVPQRLAGIRSQNFNAKGQAQPSLKSRHRDAMQSAQMPPEAPWLPGTFVRPLWRNTPSVFTHPKEAWRVQFTWAKSKFMDFGSLVIYRWQLKLTDTLLWGKRRQIVRQLHEDMYTAFASGDKNALKALCVPSFAEKLIAQIDSRPAGQKITWTLNSWLRRPDTLFRGIRILSDRATQFPDVPSAGARQIVFCITSRQTMSKSRRVGFGKATKFVEEPKKVQDCREYITIQQITFRGKPGGWRIWGHAKPTTFEDIETDPYFRPTTSLKERLNGIMSQAGLK
ncbi:hypothetical protein N7448_010326 [Penicillium atrosanguineum]|uniref:Tim44-like domain-containing protein n=1 Tax=Penicillium atrosanguineum TaxID=1132637 RepID=A0A9W9U161_9EURO|nr:uncharacterized protein N7443_007551 [Penicillium atrosanguineum]KAJ5118621.1 hypothetical protein N7526_010258 [Penicillium atrosanguineum]KAJ5119657.1 hypothetical protein N7448_010326 [Penicillium atrosanguineum]KAJ5296658.1 hypothetical protein N7443_007551 [Penicillium atrosanguineum]KAJ5299420.1 hypothetical protein N7476_010977 [Penicillium atrosanguineum]